MGGVGMREVVVILLVAALLWPYVKIISKAGYSGWWALLIFVPIVNFIALWVFAYAKWPALEGLPIQRVVTPAPDFNK